MRLSRVARWWWLSIALVVVAATSARADRLELTDGRVLIGKVAERRDGTVWFRHKTRGIVEVEVLDEKRDIKSLIIDDSGGDVLPPEPPKPAPPAPAAEPTKAPSTTPSDPRTADEPPRPGPAPEQPANAPANQPVPAATASSTIPDRLLISIPIGRTEPRGSAGLRDPKPRSVGGVAFSPKGDRITICAGDYVVIRDLRAGKNLFELDEMSGKPDTKGLAAYFGESGELVTSVPNGEKKKNFETGMMVEQRTQTRRDPLTGAPIPDNAIPGRRGKPIYLMPVSGRMARLPMPPPPAPAGPSKAPKGPAAVDTSGAECVLEARDRPFWLPAPETTDTKTKDTKAPKPRGATKPSQDTTERLLAPPPAERKEDADREYRVVASILTPDGRSAVGILREGAVHVWELGRGGGLAKVVFELGFDPVYHGPGGGAPRLSWLADGRLLVNATNRLHVIDLAAQSVNAVVLEGEFDIHPPTNNEPPEHAGTPLDKLRMSFDGRTVVRFLRKAPSRDDKKNLGDPPIRLAVYSDGGRKFVGTLMGPDAEQLNDVVFSPDSSRVAVTTDHGGVHVLSMEAFLAAAAAIEKLPDAGQGDPNVANPEFEAWADYPIGTRVEFRTRRINDGGAPAEQIRIVEMVERDAKLGITLLSWDKSEGRPKEDRFDVPVSRARFQVKPTVPPSAAARGVYPPGEQDGLLQKAGRERVRVAGREWDCDVYVSVDRGQPSNYKNSRKYWVSAKVPGFVVKSLEDGRNGDRTWRVDGELLSLGK